MKIAIADDHALVREGLAAVLSESDSITGVVEAGTLDELVAAMDREQDIGLVLLDLDMPGVSGVETFDLLQDRYPVTSVTILSATEDPVIARQFLDAGVVGYIPKSANNDLLLNAIRLILTGGIYVPLFVLNAKAGSDRAPELTARQFDVLKLMAQGHSNKGIARELDLTESTVKTHSSAVFKALGVDNRMKAIREATRLGMVEQPK